MNEDSEDSGAPHGGCRQPGWKKPARTQRPRGLHADERRKSTARAVASRTMRSPPIASLLFLLLCAPAWAVVPGGFVETDYTSNTLTPATGMAWAPDGSGRLFVTL